MAERVWRGSDTSFVGILLHDLLNPTSRVLGVATSLEQPTIVRMRGNVSPQCGRK